MNEKIPRIAQNMSQAENLFGVPRDIQKLAKRAGCPAFRAQRINGAELLQWIDQNQDLIAAAHEERIAGQENAELKRQKLAAQVERLGITIEAEQMRLDVARGLLLPRATVRESWSAQWAVIEDEAKALLPRAEFVEFIWRVKSRILS